jgi:hypothetical protein
MTGSYVNFNLVVTLIADIKAKATQTLYYSTKKTIGFEYTNNQLYHIFESINENEPQNGKPLLTINVQQATANIISSIEPSLHISLWSVLNSRLVLIPYFEIQFDYSESSANNCPPKSLYYNTSYGVNFAAQVVSLEIKTPFGYIDLSNDVSLPNPEYAVVLVPHTYLNCHYCSQCIPKVNANNTNIGISYNPSSNSSNAISPTPSLIKSIIYQTFLNYSDNMASIPSVLEYALA